MANDLISRCKLFNRLATVQTLGEAYAVIQGMETEEPASRWIPVAERLPEDGRYLVYCRPSAFCPQVMNYSGGTWFYDGCKSMQLEMPTIIAWMPLPEPFKEVEK